MRLLLLFVAFLVLVASSNSVEYDGPSIQAFTTEKVTSPTMINANFAKTFVITPPSATPELVDPIARLSFAMPGRVFVSYEDYKLAGGLVNSSVLASVRVYGDTETIVEQFAVYCASWDYEDGPEIYLGSSSLGQTENVATSGFLLVEITLFRRDQLRSIIGGGLPSLEIIVQDGVLRSRDAYPEFTAGSDGYLQYDNSSESSAFDAVKDRILMTIWDSTAVYLLSNSTPLNVSSFQIILTDQSNLYMDVISLVASIEFEATQQGTASFVAFIETLVTESAQLYGMASSSLCLFVTETFQTGESNRISSSTKVALSGKTAGIEAEGTFTCAKAKTPDHTPRDISIDSISFKDSGESVEVSSTSSSGWGASSAEGSSEPSSSSDNAAARLQKTSIVALSVAPLFFLTC